MAPRPTRIMVCTNAHADEVLTLQTTVEYSTAVQIISEYVSDSTLHEVIPRLVSGATVESVANFLCGTTAKEYDCDDDDGNVHRFLPESTTTSSQSSSSSSCVLSVSAGNPDVYLDHKCGVATFSSSCARYHGDIKVTHTDECSSQDIEETVTDILMELYHDRDFCLTLLDYTADGQVVDLGRVVFGEKIGSGSGSGSSGSGGSGSGYDEEPAVTSTITEASESRSAEGLNAGGIALLAAMGALAALALLLLFLWQRRRRRNRNNDNDAKSIHTNWSDPTADNSYLKPDFHDLGLQHSTADVHRCTSAFCEVCNRPNLGQVHLLSVGKLDLAGMQVQAEQEEQQQQQYDDDDDMDDSANNDLVPDSIYRIDDEEDNTFQDQGEPQEEEEEGMVARGAMDQDNQSGQTSLGAILDADPQEEGTSPRGVSPREEESILSYVQEDPDGYAFVRTERIEKDGNDLEKAPRRGNFGVRVFQPKAVTPPQDDPNVNTVTL